MPYIAKEAREALAAGHVPVTSGDLNYSITKLVDGFLMNNGVSYNSINAVIGVLECAKLEAYRRIAAGYEDRKARENGEVYVSASHA